MEEHIQRDLSADLGGCSPTAGSWWLPVAAWHGHRNHHPLNPPGDGDGNTHSHQSRLGFLVEVRNSGITFWASAGGYWHFSPNFTPLLFQLHPLLSPESLSAHSFLRLQALPCYCSVLSGCPCTCLRWRFKICDWKLEGKPQTAGIHNNSHF